MEKTDFGSVETFYQDEHASYCVEIIDAGKSIPRHYHKIGEETAVVVKGGASGLEEGGIYRFKKGEPHGFANDSDKQLKLLLIMIPPYDPKDQYPE